MKTDRFTLSLVTQSDISDLLGMFHEHDAFQYIYPLRKKTDEQHVKFLNLKIGEIEQRTGFYWVVRTNDTKELIGAINLTPIVSTREIQLGWMIKNKFRKKGLAFESAKMALQFALGETDFDPIYVVFNEKNIASEKIATKLNFKFHKSTEEEGGTLKTYIYTA
jgi:RimJ/RimL family protein N-acetyltransferase